MHGLVAALAIVATIFATQYSGSSGASTAVAPPLFGFSGATSAAASSLSISSSAYLRPSGETSTLPSVAAVNNTITSTNTVRAAANIAPTSAFSSGVVAAAAAAGAAEGGVTPLAELIDPSRPFILYTTQTGDTLGGLASRYGITLTTLLENNPTATENVDLIRSGDELLIPRDDGILHKVGHGETLASIVGEYNNVTADAVTAYRPNGLATGGNVESGMTLLLPGAERKPPPPPPPPPPTPPPPPAGGGGGGIAPPPAGDGRFAPPLAAYSRVTDRFGIPRGGGTIHTGIDLGMWGYPSSPIFSACDGVVTRTEFWTYSYGYHVVVDCGEGWSTLYAHMSEIHVSPGQAVVKGTTLGITGNTGFSTGEHLHFEIRLNGAPVNPADYIHFP